MIEIKKVFFSEKQEIEKCFNIRKEVFVKEQKCDPKDEYENEEESTHFLLLDNNEPVATSRYRKTQFGIKMERFAVLGSKRKKGYGLKILNFMIKDLSENKDVKYLHAQVQVVGFYEKVGFKKIGEKFDEVGIMHYKMILD